MRLFVSSLILLIATIALIVGLSNKPLEPQVDAQGPGVWATYAAAVPASPDIVCMYVFEPGSLTGTPKKIVRT